jgi:agmatine deiminase
MPAEWAHHEAVWTAWPYLDEQWSEGLDAPRRALMQMCTAIVDLDDNGRARGERVDLLVRNQVCEEQARSLLGAAAVGVRFHQASYGDIWLRDTGPLFVGAGNTSWTAMPAFRSLCFE